MSNRRRTIDMPADRARRIAIAADVLGLPSSEAFIQAAIDHELTAVTVKDPSLRKVINR